LPSGKTSDEVFLQAGLAVFALLRKQKHRSAFQIPTRIKQFMRLLLNLKNPHKVGF
jgi:hypothetical protein